MGRGVVLAVSGGPDSTAMMHLAAAWRPAGLPMWVATVDHGLRPEAATEATRVIEAAAKLGLPAGMLTWTGPKPERGLQARARAARYGLLFGFARDKGASHVVTAHTLDDQAETLLMRIAAGSGLGGLAGMARLAARHGAILARPLLGVRKSTLVALCEEHGWPFTEDPGNADARFARGRWRGLAAALATEGMTPERLGQLAQRSARAEEALRSGASRLAALHGSDAAPPFRSFRAALLDEPEEFVLRVLDAALGAASDAVTSSRLLRLERLVSALREAHAARRPVRRTLRGCTVTLDRHGGLTIRAESTRRRGRVDASVSGASAPSVSVSLNAKP